jgi:hypothetical protein
MSPCQHVLLEKLTEFDPTPGKAHHADASDSNDRRAYRACRGTDSWTSGLQTTAASDEKRGRYVIQRRHR